MKEVLEKFFGVPFDELLKTRSNFTLMEVVQLQPELDVRAMAHFNLARDGYTENNEEYREAFRNEVRYLSGLWY